MGFELGSPRSFFFFFFACPAFLQAQINTMLQSWLVQKSHTDDRIFIVSFNIYSTKICPYLN